MCQTACPCNHLRTGRECREATRNPIERLALGTAIEDLVTPVIPSPSEWRQNHPHTLRGMPGFRTARRDQLNGLTGRGKPPLGPVRLSLWVRAEDAEAHQLAAWAPHALARLRHRLTAKLVPEVRHRVALRMARQADEAREMQERKL